MPVDFLGKLARRALHVLRGAVGCRRPPLEDVVDWPDHVDGRVALFLAIAPHAIVLFVDLLLHRLDRLVQLAKAVHRLRLVLHETLLEEVIRVLMQTQLVGDALKVKGFMASLVSVGEHLPDLVNLLPSEVNVVAQADLVELLNGHLALLAAVGLLGAGRLHKSPEDTAPLISQLGNESPLSGTQLKCL